MDVTVIKNENDDEEATATSDEIDTPVKTVSTLPDNIPYVLKNFIENTDGALKIVQSENDSLTYIIENNDMEDVVQYQLPSGYVIENYDEEYPEGDEDEEGVESQYETVYIEHVDDEEDATEIYTIDEFNEDEKIIYIDGDQITYSSSGKSGKDLTSKSLTEEQQQELIAKHIKSEAIDVEDEEEAEEQEEISIKRMIVDTNDGPQSLNGDEKKNREKNAIRKKHTKIETEEIEYVDVDFGNFERDDVSLLYECNFCGKRFKSPTGVKRHVTISHWNYEENSRHIKATNDELAFSLCPCCGEPSDSAHTAGDFQCEKCEKLFVLENSLERHYSIEHPESDDYVCHECKKIFKSKESLIDHVRVHPIKSVKCQGCGRDFSRKYHLDRHIGQTGCMGIPKSVYDCRVCGKSFTRKDNLAEHLKGHAGIASKKRKRFICEYCNKEFNGMALLNIHVRTHTGEKPYPCDICEKKFPSSGAMKKHRRMHTGEKPYVCPQCGNKFAAKETLNRHWRTHTGDKPHKCQYCGKSFIQASQLRAHVFHHTGETAYTCPHCNRAFTRKLRLTTHIKFMHLGAAPLPCPAHGCEKTFFRKEDVQRHLLTHTGEKPFECELCHKSFAVKSSLRIHKLTHRKESPVVCEVCSRAFIRQDCLMRHMRARHRDILEDIVSMAEKKRLQNQLFEIVTNPSSNSLKNTVVWNEFTLTESIKELLGLLVDEECLTEFGHPEAPVDKVLEAVIRRCGYTPASELEYDYIGKMRENAKLLFTVVIDDEGVKELLNNQTVDEVIMHVLKLAREQLEKDGDTKEKIEQLSDDDSQEAQQEEDDSEEESRDKNDSFKSNSNGNKNREESSQRCDSDDEYYVDNPDDQKEHRNESEEEEEEDVFMEPVAKLPKTSA